MEKGKEQQNSNYDYNATEPEEDGLWAGALRMAKYLSKSNYH